jgi:hypothetical protein
MFKRFKQDGLRVIYIIAFVLTISSFINLIENIFINTFFQFGQVFNNDAWSVVTLMRIAFYRTATFVIILIIRNKSRKYLVDDIDKNRLYFYVGMYMILNQISGVLLIFPEIFNINQFLLNTTGIYPLHKILYSVMRIMMPIINVSIGYLFIKKNNLLSENTVDEGI